MAGIKELLLRLSSIIIEYVDRQAGISPEDIREYLMHQIDKPEFEFYLDNEDDILSMVTDVTGPLTEAYYGQRRAFNRVDDWNAEVMDKLETQYGLEEEDYIDFLDVHVSLLNRAFRDGTPANDMAKKIWLMLTGKQTHSIIEASGLKGDVLRPYNGRRARANMGYGKGNRANAEIEWPEELPSDSEVEDSMYDEDDDVPYPGGMTQDDYDQYELGPGDGAMTSFRDDEDIRMHGLDEDWTMIQTVAAMGLIPLVGTLAINYFKSKAGEDSVKGEELKAGWANWITDMRRKISPAYDQKMQWKEEKEIEKATKAKIQAAIEEFGEGKITIEQIEEIVMEDKKVAAAVQTMMKFPREGYGRLHTALKKALGVGGVRGTPIPQIKDRFVDKQTAFHADRVAIEKSAKEVIKQYADGDVDIQVLKDAISQLPEAKEISTLLDEFASGKLYNRDRFYSFLKRLYDAHLASETPGPKIMRRFKKEETQAAKNNIESSMPESFMPPLDEYWDDDERDIYNDPRADDWVDDDPDMLEDRTGKYFYDYKGNKIYKERY